jgi:non-specific serine/threonine protein kinase
MSSPATGRGPSTEAWPGGRLKDRYELKSVATSGPAGLVYLAWDHEVGRTVAVKEYLPAALAERDAQHVVRPIGPDMVPGFERGLRAFIEESRVLAQCDHPSLVRVIDVVEANGTAYRVMPWYRGRVLLDARRRMSGPIGEPALRALLDSLLGALEVYQRHGGVHGGVDPSQVLLLEDDRPVLLGPGVASRAAPVDAPHPLAARPAGGCAAPEQTHPDASTPPGPWTDFYAVAALARFCIAGPLEPAADPAAHEPLAAMARRLFGDLPAARYSAELLRTLDAALSPDIAARPQTARQFREGGITALMPQLRPPATARPDHRARGPAQAGLFWRVFEAIPEAGQAAPIATDPDSQALRTDAADRDPIATVRDLRPRAHRSHALLWTGLALAAAGVIGFGVWDLQGRRTDLADLMGTAWVAQRSAEPPSALSADAPPHTVPPPSESRPFIVRPSPNQPPLIAQVSPPLQRTTLAAPAASTSPRQECGSRTQFALYRCMQLQCEQPRWQGHPQCERLAATDIVD